MKFYIYTLSDPDTKEIRYVGASTTPKRRFRQHKLIKAKSEIGQAKQDWINGLIERGKEPLLSIIDEAYNEAAGRLETKYIKQFTKQGHRLFNFILNNRGSIFNPENYKSRADAVRKANKKPERNKKISKASKKMWSSPAHKEKLKSIMGEIVKTDAYKKKISAKSKWNWENNYERMVAHVKTKKFRKFTSEKTKALWKSKGFREKKKRYFESDDFKKKYGIRIQRSDGKEYLTAREAANDLGVHYSGVLRCCYGEQKTCKGFTFKQIKGENK